MLLLQQEKKVLLTDGERKAFLWLYGKIRLRRHKCEIHKRGISFRKFMCLIASIEQFGSSDLYKKVIKQTNKKERILHIPNDQLKCVQCAIGEKIFRDTELYFYTFPNTYGFINGKTIQALKEHTAARSFLTFDLRDAFFQADEYEFVFQCVNSMLDWRYEKPCRRRTLGHHVSKAITLLSLHSDQNGCSCSDITSPNIFAWLKHRYFLPQGSPLSPKVFDLTIRDLDCGLYHFAERFGATYSRFADNLIIGFPTDTVPIETIRCILRDIRWKIHKIKVFNFGYYSDGRRQKFFSSRLRSDNGEHEVTFINNCKVRQALGYNVWHDGISLTRNYKNKMRKAISHLRKTIELFMAGKVPKEELDSARSKLAGLYSYAKPVISGSLAIMYFSVVEDYENIKSFRIAPRS